MTGSARIPACTDAARQLLTAAEVFAAAVTSTLVHVVNNVEDPEAPGLDRLERASMLAFAARTMDREQAIENLGTVNRLTVAAIAELAMPDEGDTKGVTHELSR